MNMMVVFGSPRHSGNSAFLGREFINSVTRQDPTASISEVELQKLHIGGCLGCDTCKRNGGHCIQQDDMQPLYEAFQKADTVAFVSPVYWWGISAQLKLFIDRLYQFDLSVYKGKKLYAIIVGADEVEGIQYELIRRQFTEICDYCGMEFAGYLPVSADNENPAKANQEAITQARALYKG